jgi:hypothetical protein
MEKNINEKVSFRDFLKDAVENGKLATYRADPILTSTDSAIVEKVVFPGVDILTSPTEAALRKLGVTFFGPDLKGTLVVPSMAEDTGAFYVEWGSDYTVDASAASANMATSSLTLTPRRVSHSQAISKETLLQATPGLYNSIVQNLLNGVWNAVTVDFFKQVKADCASANDHLITGYGPDTAIYTALVGLEASMGGKVLTSPAYVITPTTRAKYSTSAKMTNQGPIFENDKINSYPAFSLGAQEASKVTFADWSKTALAQFGPVEIIVDPYTDAKKGLINLTMVGMFDSGLINYRGIASFVDPSVA